MNYKNGIFLITLAFIFFYVIIFYLVELNLELNLTQNLITKEQYSTKLAIIVFLLILLTTSTLYFYKKIEKKIILYATKQKASIKQLETINDFYNILQSCRDIINIAKESIKFTCDQFEAKRGSLYLVNEKNMNLQLLDVYNRDIDNVAKLMDLYSGIIGEAYATKKVKKYIQKDLKTFIAVPLISNDVVVGVAEFIFEEDTNIYLSKSDNIILKIVADSLRKEIEHTQNKKYIKLIDKYISFSSTNKAGEITYASNAFCDITGYRKTDLLGANHRLLRHPSVDASKYKDMWDTILDGKTWKGEIPNQKRDGTTYWADVTISPSFDYYKNITGFDSIRINTTDKKMIEKLSITDALTNLYNRRYFDKLFPQKLSISKRHNLSLVFCLMDIDHFKQYNDNYGHQMGDDTLIKVAKSLSKSLKRENDFVFRIGGEEFGALFFTEEIDAAYSMANGIRENIEELKIEHAFSSTSEYITVSMGMYIYQGENLDMDQIYKIADDLLYEAKKDGRNKIKGNI